MSNNKKCPNCGQYKIHSNGLTFVTVGLVTLIIGGILSIALIGIPIAIGGAVVTIIGIAMKIFKFGGFQCMNCHGKFTSDEVV